ncbi:MAG: hypothetical protein H7338_09775 [Candidatus Sericytochromatia bacterium]|nr:hypothetical protein [Candidatus Sericytochromatia bacterium]
MGWLEDKERIISLEAEVFRLREEIQIASAVCAEELAKGPVLGYGLDGPYADHWRGLKARFDSALAENILAVPE